MAVHSSARPLKWKSYNQSLSSRLTRFNKFPRCCWRMQTGRLHLKMFLPHSLFEKKKNWPCNRFEIIRNRETQTQDAVITFFEILCSDLSWPHMPGPVTAIFIPVTPPRSPRAPRLNLFTKWETKITEIKVNPGSSEEHSVRGGGRDIILKHTLSEQIIAAQFLSVCPCCLIRKMGIEDMMWCALLPAQIKSERVLQKQNVISISNKLDLLWCRIMALRFNFSGLPLAFCLATLCCMKNVGTLKKQNKWRHSSVSSAKKYLYKQDQPNLKDLLSEQHVFRISLLWVPIRDSSCS